MNKDIKQRVTYFDLVLLVIIDLESDDLNLLDVDLVVLLRHVPKALKYGVCYLQGNKTKKSMTRKLNLHPNDSQTIVFHCSVMSHCKHIPTSHSLWYLSPQSMGFYCSCNGNRNAAH